MCFKNAVIGSEAPELDTRLSVKNRTILQYWSKEWNVVEKLYLIVRSIQKVELLTDPSSWRSTSHGGSDRACVSRGKSYGAKAWEARHITSSSARSYISSFKLKLHFILDQKYTLCLTSKRGSALGNWNPMATLLQFWLAELHSLHSD